MLDERNVEAFFDKKLAINNLRSYKSYHNLEQELKHQDRINFDTIFHEPLGSYMIKSFLASIFSLSKATFVADVELYRKLKEISARRKVSSLIFQKFILPDYGQNVEESVFDNIEQFYNKYDVLSKSHETTLSEMPHTFYSGEHNCIGFYQTKVINEISEMIKNGEAPSDLFDKIYNKIINDLKFDIFPRFKNSKYYQTYIRLKSIEKLPVKISDFKTIGTLGQGAYGLVNAVRKINSGKVYALKCLYKKQVIASEQFKSVLDEKANLIKMDSNFVTSLDFSFTDKENLYLAIDLMPKGNLKFLLRSHRTFSEPLAKFYSAEILLGLEHIHSKEIIYRDMKLENILIDEKGHVKISDLGLSVNKKTIMGYAGTPGYTAPEMVSGDYYDKTADFFSFGVVVYRFLCGRKPFGERMGDIDKNVVKIEPKYPKTYFSDDAISFIKGLLKKNPKKRMGSGKKGIQEIKDHNWFKQIDFGLLEAGYIEPPWKPHKTYHNYIIKDLGDSRNAKLKKFKKVKITNDFNMKFKNFNYVSVNAIQKELVESMSLADKLDVKSVDRLSKGQRTEKKPNVCCNIL